MLNHFEIEKDPQKIIKIKPFISKYNWERRNVPSEKDDWEKIEKRNVTIAVNVLYARNEQINPANISKHNLNREKLVILLIISNREKWHYLKVKKL